MAADAEFDRWVLRPKPRPDARWRLFCLPYAGGGASIFHHWPALLPSSIEVCSVQLPGRENRFTEAPYRDSATLARDFLAIVLPYLERPFALFGHSLGALVAFEFVRQLTAAGGPPARRLFVSASRPPHYPNRRPPMRVASDEALLAELHQLGGTPQSVLMSPELMALALPTLRADFAVHETHRSEAVLDVPITAFCGAADREVSIEEMGAWGARTHAAFSLHVIAGDHFFLREQPERLLAHVVDELEVESDGQD